MAGGFSYGSTPNEQNYKSHCLTSQAGAEAPKTGSIIGRERFT